jgi:hypothetical protein
MNYKWLLLCYVWKLNPISKLRKVGEWIEIGVDGVIANKS